MTLILTQFFDMQVKCAVSSELLAEKGLHCHRRNRVEYIIKINAFRGVFFKR
jgi:hypothetical protein